MGVRGSKIQIARNDGVGSYGNLVSFAESPRRAGLYYTGSDDGLVHVSRDAGKTWTNVTEKIPGLPKTTYVSEVAPSRFADGTVYATFDGHRLNDFATYVFASDDYGATWRSIAGDLPKGQVVRTITEDLKNPDVLYLGTETGLFVTLDRGRRWTRVKANLPTVPVYEIALHPRDNDMILATHGRSIWILDDLTPFQQYAKVSATEAGWFDPPPAVQRNASNERMREFEGDRRFLGRNPERAAMLTYFLKSAAKEVRLAIRDGSGAVVRELAGDAMKDRNTAGLHTVYWDLRIAPLPAPRGQQPGGPGGGGGFGGAGLNGPIVLPGEYRVALVVDGRDQATTTVRVSGDPDIDITDADRRTHFETLRSLHALQATANEAADAVSAIGDQIGGIRERLRDTKDIPASVRSGLDDADKALASLRRTLGLGVGGPGGGGGFGGGAGNVRGVIGQLKGGIMGSTSLPTETQMRMVGEARAGLAKAIDEANALIAKLPALYEEVGKSGLYPAPPKPIRPIGTSSVQ
jgi:hypothetical protein